MLFLRVFTSFVVQPLAVVHENYHYCAPLHIRIVLQEMGWKSVDWIHVAEDINKWQTLVNTVQNLWVL
jgi:hypothetical protein